MQDSEIDSSSFHGCSKLFLYIHIHCMLPYLRFFFPDPPPLFNSGVLVPLPLVPALDSIFDSPSTLCKLCSQKHVSTVRSLMQRLIAPTHRQLVVHVTLLLLHFFRNFGIEHLQKVWQSHGSQTAYDEHEDCRIRARKVNEGE